MTAEVMIAKLALEPPCTVQGEIQRVQRNWNICHMGLCFIPCTHLWGNSDVFQHFTECSSEFSQLQMAHRGSKQTGLGVCVQYVHSTHTLQGLRRIGYDVYLTLSEVVIHSGPNRVDFQKETPFITFMWSSLPPEMSPALWKQPFICCIMWV